MIPVRLSLRNFMCYRQIPPLDFTSIHLACLSGDNGNGKSALIDAMTWALWGEARGNVSADDLMNAHAQEMEVQFEFKSGSDNYLILRKRARPKKASGAGQSILELYVMDGDVPRSISGGTLGQTQDKITNEVLHMDYDTFVNSAYLRQGRADEFTRQTAAKRKEVLTTILGLSFYDELEAQAKALQKKYESDKAGLEKSLVEIAAALALKPGIEAELAIQNARLAQLTEEVTKQELSLKELGREKELLEQKKQELDHVQSRLKTLQSDIKLWEDQLKAQSGRVRDYQSLIAAGLDIEAGFARYAEARRVNEQLFQDSRRLSSLNQREHELEMAVKHAEQSLVSDRTVFQTRIKDLENRLHKLPGLKQELEITEAVLKKTAENAELLKVRKELQQLLLEEVSRLQSGRSQLERESIEIADKIKMLSGQHEAKCPLCERGLEVSGLHLIEAKFAAERAVKIQSLADTEKQLGAKRDQLDALKKEVTSAEADLEQKKSANTNKQAVLSRQINDCLEAEIELGGLTKHLAEVQARIDARQYAAAERESLKALEVEISQIGYSSEKHEQARHALTDLEVFQQQKLRLEEARKNIAAEQQNQERLNNALDESKRRLETENTRSAQLSGEIIRLPEYEKMYAESDAVLRKEKQDCEQSRQAVWTLNQRLVNCAEMENKSRAQSIQRDEFAKLEGVYGELAKAFGKTGVQALLIEQALPDIEDEANKLLGRMTDNRMHLRFDTQKENKKGNTVETLDINIADEMGTRPYEMFSGGEAFRINFAIRIALSKLLARRAGAPLPTLIIDEGFGTQDAGGIEKLKEAINSIQDDFQKVLVITHIEELREAFPTRIDVVKDGQGSTVTVR